MARIYLKWPQWCQRISCQQEQLSGLRQITIIVFTVLILAIVAIIFIEIQYAPGQDDSRYQLSSLPTLGNTYISSHGPDLHYGIVIDCGSSGSRVYVYFWPPHSGNPQDLLNIQQLKDTDGNPVVKKISPGLDKFGSNPGAASEYIRPLLEFAKSYIPQQHHKETLLYILATAGMRMLDEMVQKAILDDLQTDIPKEFDFVISENNFEVISGKQEGIYAWIAVNYLLQKFGHGEEDHPLVAVEIPGDDSKKNPHIRRRTVGIIDMGGGSMQIAYEITSQIQVDDIPKPLLAEFNLGCHNSDIEHLYRVYITSFLEFGANKARDRYEEQLVKSTSLLMQSPLTSLNATKEPSKIEIPDACLPVNLVLESKDKTGIVNTFKGTGDYLQCQNKLIPLLNLTVPCQREPCSLNGVHQPYINFHNSEFYGFSEFWYTMEDVFRIGGQYEYEAFIAQAKEYCLNKWSKIQEWYDKKLYPKADENRMRMQCFKSAWMTAVLHKGLKFPEDYKNFHSVQYIQNKDVQWTLGALIHRTRYLPLRDLETMGSPHIKPSWWRGSRLIYNEYLIVVCIFIVVMAIFLYMKRLKLCPKRPAETLSRVPSMSYFRTESDQMEQGIKFKTSLYP
ncbi:hypothetical protein ACJMK2_005117 [Sinanodonta woodiana]|uniref:Ectonucleoside triphosphate diphosphohydrolase 4 n=1 Tax=Sinanodonta woodiana TaxID=1069815 RepID=A0ABD3VP34_SINWO